MTLRVVYTDAYLDWQLGAGHPTNPMRAKLATDLLRSVMGDAVAVVEPRLDAVALARRLSRVHDPAYVDRALKGFTDEWVGHQPQLGATAALMAEGTLKAWDALVGEARLGRRRAGSWGPVPGAQVWFNPQGAKHHAMSDRSSGFCVFNDMALVAMEAADLGLRTLYIDWDVHHGDGVEALTHHSQLVSTASIHGQGIFPGTGLTHDLGNWVLNYALPGWSGDEALHDKLSTILYHAQSFTPDLVLLATGADGLAEDPLGNLSYTIPGLAKAGETLGHWAGSRDLPVIVGGAGGYTPLKETPLVWASVVSSLYNAHQKAQTALDRHAPVGRT